MINRLTLFVLVTCLTFSSCIKDEFEDKSEAHFIKAIMDSVPIYADQSKGDVFRESNQTESYYIYANRFSGKGLYFYFQDDQVIGTHNWDSVDNFNVMPVQIFANVSFQSNSYYRMTSGQIEITALDRNPLIFKATFSGEVIYEEYNQVLGKYVYDTARITNGVANIEF